MANADSFYFIEFPRAQGYQNILRKWEGNFGRINGFSILFFSIQIIANTTTHWSQINVWHCCIRMAY